MDLILLSGNIITMSAINKREQAVAVNDGLIAAVGDNRYIKSLKNNNTKVVDLGGKTVLPGFHDTHIHGTLTGMCLTSARLEAAKSVKEVCSIIKEKAKTTKEGEWVYGFGCIPWELKEKRLPTMVELDAVATKNPVYISAVTFHSGATNGLGFKLINPDPSQDGVEIDKETGKPTGLFITDEAHFAASSTAFEALSDQDLSNIINDVANYAAGKGVTTFHALDGQFIKNDRDVVIHKEIQSELPIDSIIMYQTMEIDRVLNLKLPRIGGCLCIDGACFEHTALYYEPYCDAPDTCGDLYFSEKETEEFIEAAHVAGLQIGMHAIGDRAIDILVKAYKKAIEKYPRNDHRHRIEHFISPTGWAINQAKELGLALTMQPTMTYLWDNPGNSDYERMMGKARSDQMDPYPQLVNSGIVIAGGSDSPVTEINPLLGIHSAANNPNPIRRISIDNALRMFTINAAWVGREEKIKGTIEPGKQADFVVLDRDPYLEAEHIKDFEVTTTISKGNIVYQQG